MAKKDTLIATSKIINQLSYYWKLDSIAGNGFRLSTYNQVLKSKLDHVSKDFLVEKLGKPNQLRTTNHGTEYVYYYFDIKAMPKNYNAPLACWYIAFHFKVNENFASEIVEGDIDR
ncbi:MAG: hypothetical protein EOO46_18155 [Flavobacterium sp.]|nr:MAG: hypothetical protein EOO46_18155 [Flavobacterium sp.]